MSGLPYLHLLSSWFPLRWCAWILVVAVLVVVWSFFPFSPPNCFILLASYCIVCLVSYRAGCIDIDRFAHWARLLVWLLSCILTRLSTCLSIGCCLPQLTSVHFFVLLPCHICDSFKRSFYEAHNCFFNKCVISWYQFCLFVWLL